MVRYYCNCCTNEIPLNEVVKYSSLDAKGRKETFHLCRICRLKLRAYSESLKPNKQNIGDIFESNLDCESETSMNSVLAENEEAAKFLKERGISGKEEEKSESADDGTKPSDGRSEDDKPFPEDLEQPTGVLYIIAKGDRVKLIDEGIKYIRLLFDRGYSPSNIARLLSIPYNNVYTCIQRYKTEIADSHLVKEIDTKNTEEVSNVDDLAQTQRGLVKINNRYVDVAKIHALLKAGWKVKDIAGDMGLEESVVYTALTLKV